MKKIHEHMMNCKLHTRLMIYFSTLVIISMLLVAGISYVSSYYIMKDFAKAFSMQAIESVIDNLNDVIQEAENLTALVESDSLFQEILDSEMPSDIRKQYSIELQYDFELYRLTGYTSNSFGGLYVLGNNGLNFKSHNVAFRQEDFRKTDWYQRILSADTPVWFAPKVYSRVSKSIDIEYVAVGCSVISKTSGKKTGIVLIELEADTLEYILEKYGNIENGMIQIFDQSEILFQKNGKLVNESSKKNPIFSYTEKLKNGWVIETYIPKKILLGGMLNLGFWLAVVISLLILAAVKITDAISKTVTNPIKRLIELMDDAEENTFDVQMHVRYRDELAALGHKFNSMMAFTRCLIEKNNQEQENLREAELKALQMQINPHFLYNTLETVIWLIRSGDGQKAVYVVTALSKFFRIGLSGGRNAITLREELEHVKEYIKIQNTRYRERINFSIELEDPALLSQILPKLVLQPLVENAIYHGIQEKENGSGKVKILIGYSDTEHMHIDVMDDGVGMSEEKLEYLQKSLDVKGQVGYALYNTNQRLRKYFGAASGLSIESISECGTCVSFTMPIRREEYDKDNFCR